MKYKQHAEIFSELMAHISDSLTSDSDFAKKIADSINLICKQLVDSNCLFILKHEYLSHLFYKKRCCSTVYNRAIVAYRCDLVDHCMKKTLASKSENDKDYSWHVRGLEHALNQLKSGTPPPDEYITVSIMFRKKRVGLFIYPAGAIQNGGENRNYVNKLIKQILSIMISSELICDIEKTMEKSEVLKILVRNNDKDDLDTFYRRLIDSCQSAFKAGAASLYLQSNDGQELRAVAAFGASETWIDDITYGKNDESGLTCHVWQTKQPFRWSFDNMALVDEFATIVQSKGKLGTCQSLISVPVMINRDECIGVLKVERLADNENSVKPFNWTDQRRLETIAHVVASHLANERKFFDEIVFGRPFFDKIFQACDTVLKDGEEPHDIPKKLSEFILLIKRFASVLKQSKCASRDELFEYVKQFNINATAIIGATESNDLNNVIQNLPELERFLYKIPKYRDHMIHQAQVFLIGFLILASLKEVDLESIWEIKDDRIGFKDGSWLKRWFLASAFHDIGYSFEKVEDWPSLLFKEMLRPRKSIRTNNKSLVNWGSLLAEGEIGSHFETLLSHIYKIFDINNEGKKRKIRQALLKETIVNPCHSTIGALVFLDHVSNQDSIENEQESIRTSLSELFLDAALAICLHVPRVARTIKEAIGLKRISFKNAPFALLLTFCDTIHNWGRDKPGQVNSSETHVGAPEFVDYIPDNNGNLKIVLSYSSDGFSINDFLDVVYKEHISVIEQDWHGNDKFCIEYHHKYNGRSEDKIKALRL